METIFAVVFETAYVTKILFEGTKMECKAYIRLNPEFCDDYVFVQELECV